MTHKTRMELSAELRMLGRKVIEGIEKGRDYSEFEKRFNLLDKFLTNYPI